ncbi:MAG TPA: hypothetical protein VFR55_11280 [Dehalococcoidia bacterium]|nr:hypothetical protein [Dehalococcoidia bacterium]
MAWSRSPTGESGIPASIVQISAAARPRGGLAVDRDHPGQSQGLPVGRR